MPPTWYHMTSLMTHRGSTSAVLMRTQECVCRSSIVFVFLGRSLSLQPPEQLIFYLPVRHSPPHEGNISGAPVSSGMYRLWSRDVVCLVTSCRTRMRFLAHKISSQFRTGSVGSDRASSQMRRRPCRLARNTATKTGISLQVLGPLRVVRCRPLHAINGGKILRADARR